MAKKNNPQKKQQSAVSGQKKTAASRQIKTPRWMLPFVLLITFLAFLPALKAGFVNWDDPDYVSEPVLKLFSSDFKSLITIPIQGNYHPLTMLSLVLNYFISGMNPWSYHLVKPVVAPR
jgi:hypothetical protein